MSKPDLTLASRFRRTNGVRRGAGALAVLGLAHFVIDSYSSSYAPMLAALRDQLGLSLAEIGGGAAVFAFSASIMQPVYGLISDRVRTSMILSLAPALTAISLAMVTQVESYSAVLVWMFVAGIGIAAFHPQGATQASDALPHRPSMAMALFVGAGNLGFASGPVLVSVTMGLWGWEGLWRMAIPGVLVTLFVLPLAPTPEVPGRRAQHGVKKALKGAWKPLLILYLYVVVRGTIQLNYVSFLLVFLTDGGLTMAAASAGLSAFLAIGSIGSLVGGVLGDKLGLRRTMRVSMGVALPLFAGSFMMPTLTLQLAVLCVAFFFILLSNPVTIVLAQSWLPDHRNTVSSLMMGFAWGVGGLLAPVVGLAADSFGLSVALFWIGMLALVGLLLATQLPGAGPQTQTASS